MSFLAYCHSDCMSQFALIGIKMAKWHEKCIWSWPWYLVPAWLCIGMLVAANTNWCTGRGYLNKCSIHCFVIKWHPVKSTYYRICGKKHLRWQLLLADYELKYATAQRLKGQLALESLGAIINYASTMMVAMLKSKCGVIYLFLYIHCKQISLEMFWMPLVYWVLIQKTRAGSGVERVDTLYFLAWCRKSRLNQVLSVLSLNLGFSVYVYCAVN